MTWRGFPNVPVLMFGPPVPRLNEIWIINLSSSLVGTSSSKLFRFSKEAHLNVNRGVRLFILLQK